MGNKKNIEEVLAKINKDKYELFIFDFDGTLVESLKVDWIGLKKRLCTLLGIDFREGLRVSSLLDEIKRTQGDKGLKEAYGIVGQYESEAIGEVKVRREIEDFIKKVSAEGKKVAIFSANMRETIEAILSQFGFLEKINFIISKEDVKNYKPYSEGLLKILTKLRISPVKAIFIGDSDLDLLAGKRAKVKTVKIDGFK